MLQPIASHSQITDIDEDSLHTRNQPCSLDSEQFSQFKAGGLMEWIEGKGSTINTVLYNTKYSQISKFFLEITKLIFSKCNHKDNEVLDATVCKLAIYMKR